MSNKHYRRIENDHIIEFSRLNNNDLVNEKPKEKLAEKLNKFNFLLNSEKNCEEVITKSEEEENEELNECTSYTTKKKKKKKNKKSTRSFEEDLFLCYEKKESIKDNNNYDLLRRNVLKIDGRDLNPDAELLKLLGKTLKKTVEIEKRKAKNVRNPQKMRSKLVKINPQWPSVKHTGISMIVAAEKNNIKWYQFVYDETYLNLNELFDAYQRHMDYEAIINDVMFQCPYHLKSLLLYAEHMRITENKESARDAIERGLYACENAFHLSFQPLSFESRLNYVIPENRLFYLFLYHYMLENINRNCFVTALEFAKIIFYKDPDSDPLGILLIIDSLALKAKKYKFLINFYTVFKEEKQLDMLPNFLYSISIAWFMISVNLSNKCVDNQINDEKEEAENNFKMFLKTAIIRFPFLLGQILDKLQVKADSLVENNNFLNTLAYYKENEGLQLISDIYLHHTQDIWKISHVLSWLEVTTHEILKDFFSTKLVKEINDWKKLRKRCFIGIPRNVMRHALIHSIRQDKSNDNFTLVDPCPPRIKTTNVIPKLSRNENETYQESLSNLMIEFLKSLMPQDVQMQLKSISGSAKSYVEKTLKWFQNNNKDVTNQLPTSNEIHNLNLEHSIESPNLSIENVTISDERENI